MPLTLPFELTGRYRLTQRIGQGSFAETYLATDTTLDRQVAIKVLREQFASDARVAMRFEREARAAASVHHPNVVEIYDYGRDDSILYIVMEWVDGTDLKEYLQRHAPLRPAEATRLIRGILAGIAAIHRAGIIHRDIKSHNVLIAHDSGTVKLTDFGIARGALDAGLTDTGMAIGTAAYMAPEQASGAPITPAVDIYAAGVILYEMLTGRLPYPGDNPVQVMYQHVNEAPPRPRSLNPDVPPALEMVAMRALAKDPRDRYESAEAMSAAIDHVPSADEATRILAAASTPAEATRLAPGIGGRPPRPPSNPPRRAVPAPEPHSTPTWPLVLLAGIIILLAIGGLAYLATQGSGTSSTPTPDATRTAAAALANRTPTATATPQPTATPTPSPTATPTPTPTPQPTPTPTPTPTPVPPTPTPVPPTPTPVPTGTPQSLPSGVQVGQPISGALLRLVRLGAQDKSISGTDFKGAYTQKGQPGQVGGNLGNSSIFFGKQSDFDTGTATFNGQTSSRPWIVVSVKGMDDNAEPKTTMQVALNGTVIYTGPDPLANGQSDEVGWVVPNRTALKQGPNTLTISNESPGSFGPQQPWFLIQSATVWY